MKVAVVGLWHLGLVTAASLASAGHEVIGLDDEDTAAALRRGHLPLHEPGLDDLIRDATAQGTLSFAADPGELRDAEIVWVTYDTPIDLDDRADVETVLDRIRSLFPHVGDGALVLISSQLPVGSTRALESSYRALSPKGTVTFAYSPENLRLGQALMSFQQPDRVVVGIRTEAEKGRITHLLAPFTKQIDWMRVESAEMTKHALNSWLAMSIAFINEIATLSERVGADAGEVARGLKSDARIGQRAYLRPGAGFAGGTLARDLTFLTDLAGDQGVPIEIVPAVRRSNDMHRSWPQRRLRDLLPELRGSAIAVLGLTYKPGTSTLRRSSAVELCSWLSNQGARVSAWDPAVTTLPPDLAAGIELRTSPTEALRGASAAVVATEWPDLASIQVEDVLSFMEQPIVLDPGRFLESQLGGDSRIQYLSVGRAE